MIPLRPERRGRLRRSLLFRRRDRCRRRTASRQLLVPGRRWGRWLRTLLEIRSRRTMGAPFEFCSKRGVVAVLASGVVISLTALTGGIAPAFAQPGKDQVLTTTVAPEPEAPVPSRKRRASRSTVTGQGAEAPRRRHGPESPPADPSAPDQHRRRRRPRLRRRRDAGTQDTSSRAANGCAEPPGDQCRAGRTQ